MWFTSFFETKQHEDRSEEDSSIHEQCSSVRSCTSCPGHVLVSLHGWFGKRCHSKMLLFCRGVQKTLPPLDHAYTNTESYNILEIRKHTWLVFDVPNRCGQKTQDFITIRQLQEGTSFRIRCVCLGQMFGSENCVTQRIASRSDNIINRLLSAYDGGASCVLHTSHIAFRILPNHQ